jgi:[protein-PII] uridylyltransferase
LGGFSEFGRLTCQVQHDLYHKYTTDEHTLRALDVLDAIADGADSKHAPYRKVLNEIHDSSSLYFAVLMHDTGKGLGKGHSAKGASLVSKALDRLGFDPDEERRFRPWCGITCSWYMCRSEEISMIRTRLKSS